MQRAPIFTNIRIYIHTNILVGAGRGSLRCEMCVNSDLHPYSLLLEQTSMHCQSVLDSMLGQIGQRQKQSSEKEQRVKYGRDSFVHGEVEIECLIK